MTAIIIEDEKIYQQELIKLISREHPDLEVLGTANTLDSAAKLLRENTPDILFLDIELGADNGLDLIRAGIPPTVKPIIVSNHSKYGVAACNLSATAFVQKGEMDSKLSLAIEKAKRTLDQETQRNKNKILTQSTNRIPNGHGPDRLVINTRSIDYFVPIDKIIYLEAQGNHVHFFLDEFKDVPSPTCGLKFYADGLLPIQPTFQKPHHSFLVNMEKVDALIKGSKPKLLMKNDQLVPISKPNIARIKKALSVFGML